MKGFPTDLRLAARALARAPGFTAVALLTLALGIGANTAVFTLVDGVLLQPLHFDEPDRLVGIEHLGRDGQDRLPVSEGLYVLYRDRADALEGIGLHQGASVNLVGDGEPERVTGRLVTPGFFEVLRVPPLVGRTFVPEEGRPGAEPVVALSEGLWEERFGRDPAVLDRTLRIDGVSRRVVGVLPRLSWPDAETRLWLPMVIDEANAALGSFSPDGVARLASGSSVESARTEMQGLISRLPELFPGAGDAEFLMNVGLRAEPLPLKEAVVGELDTTLLVLLGTVAFVLLIACANVANLFLVRAEGRQRELALRVAVGARRMDLLRPFAAESLVLAAGGGALGVLVAAGAVRATMALVPADLPRAAEVGIDLRVLAFTAAASLVAALLFGLLPALRQDVGNLSDRLKDGAGRGATGGRGGNRLRSGLIVTQVALAMVLLVGSGLMLRSFAALRSVDPGFQAEGVLTVRLSVPEGEVPEDEAAADFFRQITERLATQPGVREAGLVSAVPLGGGQAYGSLELEDFPTAPGERPSMAFYRWAGPGYFEAMGIPLVEGRSFRPGDGAAGFRGVVVTEAFRAKWWPGESAVGRRVRGGPYEGWYEVVGVVADAHYRGLATPPEDMVFWPLTVGPAEDPGTVRTLDVVVDVETDPAGFLPVVRREVWAVNPRIPLSNPRSMAEVLEQSMSRTSFTMVVLGAASLVALLLGMVGIYGVVSYVVSQRTREIGVRMALGASRGEVRGMVVGQGMLLAAAGVAAGLLAAAAASRVMASLLYGVDVLDPLTYGGTALALAAAALLATAVPAWRASRVEPSVALRRE